MASLPVPTTLKLERGPVVPIPTLPDASATSVAPERALLIILPPSPTSPVGSIEKRGLYGPAPPTPSSQILNDDATPAEPPDEARSQYRPPDCWLSKASPALFPL